MNQGLTVADLDSHIRWKQAPLPAEACSELGADADDEQPTSAQWRVLIAICIGAWPIPILAMTIAAGVASWPN
jgi:hypothetical protein